MAVDIEECSARVSASDAVEVNEIKQGIIDTISGPVVDAEQKFHATGWAVGNAASPGLTGMYLGPGSTLGNALVTGYIASKSWASAFNAAQTGP